MEIETMELTKEQLDAILKDHTPSIIAGVKSELESAVKSAAQYEITTQIKAEVMKWVKDNVMPEVLRRLTESRDGFIQIGVAVGGVAAEAIASAFAVEIKRKLENSYERKKLFQDLFG